MPEFSYARITGRRPAAAAIVAHEAESNQNVRLEVSKLALEVSTVNLLQANRRRAGTPLSGNLVREMSLRCLVDPQSSNTLTIVGLARSQRGEFALDRLDEGRRPHLCGAIWTAGCASSTSLSGVYVTSQDSISGRDGPGQSC